MFAEADLLRLIEGDCSPEEAAAIQAWIAADPTRGELLDQLRAVWRLTGDTSRSWDVPESLTRRSRAPRRSSLELVATRRPWWRAPWPRQVAATIAVLLAASLLWRLPRPAGPSRSFATARGQLSSLTLPDGSRALLGVDTRLRVPRDYGIRQRMVDLDGEAYFVVEHDARRPFIVRTPRGSTEDLGTEFAVRAYRQEGAVQVVVVEGRVALRGPNGADSVLVTLRPRERAVLDSGGKATVTRDVTLAHSLAWTRGTLLFDDAPLGGVIAQLERWYDLEITTDDATLADERVTISFMTKSADEALVALAQVLNVRATRAGRLVRLDPVGPRH
ncbi:MAG TPA: FecR domain-containing protein [Gemmatimonadales bacterium]|nr:FecR domain-containing protein [Gemmatimonadales bacterium]